MEFILYQSFYLNEKKKKKKLKTRTKNDKDGSTTKQNVEFVKFTRNIDAH